MSKDLRTGLIRLAYSQPELRSYLLPLLRTASVAREEITLDDLGSLGIPANSSALKKMQKRFRGVRNSRGEKVEFKFNLSLRSLIIMTHDMEQRELNDLVTELVWSHR